jgi:hypothetical protein
MRRTLILRRRTYLSFVRKWAYLWFWCGLVWVRG